MKQISKTLIVVFAITFGVFASALAQETKPCISAKDIEDVGKNFKQVADLIKPGQVQYCESDLGAQWYQLTNSLVTLKNMKPNEPLESIDDAFTYKAINESNWWTYFTARANSFDIRDKCQDGVVAFVMPMFGAGEVNLCPLFFEQNITSQASVMMHEVRHFDGFSHVTCTHGSDAGSAGACDTDILDKGSYAITAQTLVAMARSNETTADEKPMVEAEAIFTMFNRFNVVPKTRVERAVILSNTSGEVYKWNIEGDSLELLATLPQAARVYAGFANNMTIFPVDTTVDAYRLNSTFKTNIPGIGLFANTYNALTPDVRGQYQSITYNGAAGLLKNNVIETTCGASAMTSLDLSATGDFKRILTLSTDNVDSGFQSYLLNANGEMYSYKCQAGSADTAGTIEVQKSELAVEASLLSAKDMMGLGGKIFVLTGDGQLAEVRNVNNQIVNAATKLPFKNQNWVSISSISQAEVFKQ